MNAHDQEQQHDAAADEGGRCLRVIKNVVAVRNGREEIGWGDVFLTSTDLYFVRYDVEYGQQRGADGLKYTLGGLLVGGPAGALVGAAIDGSRASGRHSKQIEKVKRSAERLRKEDFGLPPSERLEKRGGATVHRLAGQRAERIADWWISLAVPGGTLAVSYEHSPLGLAQGESTFQSWAAGNAKASRETEGANVGVCLEEFLKSLCSDAGGVTAGCESDCRMASDREYVAEFAARLLKRPGESVDRALRSLSSRSGALWESLGQWLSLRGKRHGRFAIGYSVGSGVFAVSAAIFTVFAAVRGDPFRPETGAPNLVIASLLVAVGTLACIPLLISELVDLARVRRTLRLIEVIGLAQRKG